MAFWFWLGLLFKKVFQLLKFTVAGSLYKVNARSGLIYDLGRKAWAKIKAQAGSDHRNCTGNGKLDHRFRKPELFQGFIYMFLLVL